MESEVRHGAIQVQKASGLGKKFQKKYGALYRRSNHGVSRLEIFESKDGYEKRGKKHIISLENVATIERTRSQDGKKPDLQIKLMYDDNKEQVFQTETDQDKELWYAALSGVIFGRGSLTDNVIYQQFEEEGYDVVVKENEVVQKLSLKGMYRLVITDKNVELRDKNSKKPVATWPLMLLRKYGRDKQEFSLEAGRRCQTGPGMFYFITDHYNEIFQDVDSKVRNLAERTRAPSTSSFKIRKSPVGNPPDSPLPSSPAPSFGVEGEYADPRDQVQFPRSQVAEEPVYNEPVNTKPSVKVGNKGKKPASPKKGGPPKPERAQPKKFGLPIGKKDKKGKSKPDAPVVEEATYSEALAIPGGASSLVADSGEAYGRLDFEGKRASNISSGDENQYDSLNMGWAGNANNTESEYASTTTVNQRLSNLSVDSDGVYDHVKH